MPYVPAPAELARLRSAIQAAAFREGERVWWLSAFLALLVMDIVLLVGGASWLGIAASLAGFLILFWRLRGVHLRRHNEANRDLFGLGLASREQRAFTGLMLRHALTGRNPLDQRPEHDPFADWATRRATRPQAAEEA
ncbi:MAG TPA: hypothetical protein VNE62_08915 [Actinomycetota bacterium]|nr:hypothetical protein [Actinomycetota bacterium]